jgi:hypothetical protein
MRVWRITADANVCSVQHVPKEVGSRVRILLSTNIYVLSCDSKIHYNELIQRINHAASLNRMQRTSAKTGGQSGNQAVL